MSLARVRKRRRARNRTGAILERQPKAKLGRVTKIKHDMPDEAFVATLPPAPQVIDVEAETAIKDYLTHGLKQSIDYSEQAREFLKGPKK